ncbi:RNA polymerase sigma factor [Candidatus Uabimicrobium amorphum]|uniref:DNA-directed RNA polymerase sigma-70 factor n=1 Tax=Uabimicrobium amorphum TaxID=2596890 RepID=A0A5S9F4R2_UABAM|nr:sigma-70 family RNA polymerase sigma factor [Candidatus Uabimicrobium amorphum]BBM85383.1 DNA-directed RNA polymerase sigma-70 factor [Candidatus Uabimicrobium amorphum]
MKWWKSKRAQLQDIFEQYCGAMSLYACSFLGDFQAGEDVVQEIFMSLLKNENVPDSPKSYLMQAVRNRCMNYQRVVKLKSLNEEVSQVWFTHPLEKEEERATLTNGLSSLPQEQREVVVLKIWGNLTFKEIGTTVGISPNTAASRYQYALKHLKDIFHSHEVIS